MRKLDALAAVLLVVGSSPSPVIARGTQQDSLIA